jgi:hypothetical protein
MAKKDQDAPGLDFLDFLFTVAMGVGLTPEVAQQTGLLTLSSKWSSLSDPLPSQWLGIWVFGLALLNLILSWFGYHASIRFRPLNYNRGVGLVRFTIDVLLVIIYGIALVKFMSFPVVLTIFVIVYVIFFLWDILKIIEYWKPAKRTSPYDVPRYFSVQLGRQLRERSTGRNKKSLVRIIVTVFRREFVSLGFAMFFIITAVLYHYCQWDAGTILIMMFAGSVLYRINKIHSWKEMGQKVYRIFSTPKQVYAYFQDSRTEENKGQIEMVQPNTDEIT